METSRAQQQQNQVESRVNELEVDEAERQLEEEVRELEERVNQTAERVLELRTTLPHQLKTTLASLHVAQRPVSYGGSESQPDRSSDPLISDVEGPSRRGAALAEEMQKQAEKVQLLKQKISSIGSALPIVLNKRKECMARIDKLQSRKKAIRPVFKRKRTS
ncbi:PREDICTED: uncharacterized protein LOC109206353 [Nicotiana attenuata]|uniref:Uncharacterized protein n=1 Tax=Nicotiana attenuata TaxID=49451 RepID=A0A314KUJ3_NICAT|nr:PREDICTED: uncharacterized protein LOC109206353 [Nicotiana attenuata]OIT33161.1 hypothetical protein A4A49_06597 [Nicotiana attenuata]